MSSTRRQRVTRPSKISEATRKTLTDAVGAGLPYKSACAIADLDFATFRLWMVRGEAERRGEYSDFFAAVERARAVPLLRAVATIQKNLSAGGALGQRAAEFLIARRDEDDSSR